MSLFNGDPSEIYDMGDDLLRVSAKAVPTARTAVLAGAKEFERAWRSDAARLHDNHARYYPDSIDSELAFGATSIAADVGPNSGKKQGFLGRILEFGGERSPAYLTGLRALDRSEAAIERKVTDGMNSLF